jgi:hypothetical protein
LEIVNSADSPAENQVDIIALNLFRSRDIEEKLTELFFDQQRNIWRLPDHKKIQIYDTDLLFIMADISPTARDGRSIRLHIPNDGIQTNARPTFIGNIIQAPTVQTINNPAAAASPNIEGVEVGPNPAKNHVSFFYTLDTTSSVEIKIFDRAGRLIEEIVEPSKTADNRAKTEWNASQVAPGLYFARIRIKSSQGERLHKTQIVIER